MRAKPTTADRVLAYLGDHPGSSARDVAAALSLPLITAKDSLWYLKHRCGRIHENGKRRVAGVRIHVSLYAAGEHQTKAAPPTPARGDDPFASLHAMQRTAQQHQQFRRP